MPKLDAKIKIQWNDNAGDDYIAEVNKRCEKAMQLLLAHIRTSLGTRQPTVFSGGRLRGLDPSKPGEWPKIVTEKLRKSYQYTKKKHSNESTRHVVFTKSLVALFMELGTRRMAKRKQLGVALQEKLPEMLQIIEKG